VNPRATWNACKRLPRFKSATPSIRRNAPERINA